MRVKIEETVFGLGGMTNTVVKTIAARSCKESDFERNEYSKDQYKKILQFVNPIFFDNLNATIYGTQSQIPFRTVKI